MFFVCVGVWGAVTAFLFGVFNDAIDSIDDGRPVLAILFWPLTLVLAVCFIPFLGPFWLGTKLGAWLDKRERG